MVSFPRSASRTAVHPPASPASVRLTPLAAALALAWSLPALAAPPVAAVPVPAATWRVSGSGRTAAPVNSANPQGGVDQTISQTSARAIYNWQSFDIGANSSVTFDMAQQGASALNRVTGSTAPSQIFGQLKATNKGEIVLINANGILFGQGAQVNTGALIASTLAISDSEYQSGFAQSIGNPSNATLNAAFRYEGDPANFIDGRSFVRVNPGATITTDSGGRVFLFAKKVDNAGSISAPDGQVVLGAGGAVYLKLPSSEAALYASESNPNVSALRGFLVEVGNGPANAPQGGAGTASNAGTGVISTPRGNTTLVAMAVNQMGRLSATTSVSENGSIILRAQGHAQSNDQGLDSVVRATESGALVLGAGSSIQVLPDTETRSSTSTDSAGFATSHLDLAGQSIVFGSGASIVAPGATVNLRAETVPSYVARLSTASFTGGQLAAGDPGARIVMGDQAVIDVSGTRSTERSVADLFVTTELLGSNDLKDAPLQKDGLLYRSKVTIDTRQDSAILGSLDSYRANIGRTVEERLSSGGTVDLRAEGAVLTHPGASIRVTGGEVSYTAASVKPTLLVGSNGALYDLNTAPADQVYASALNLEKSSAIRYDRWGARTGYGGSLARSEAGYVEGRDAGSVSIAAPVVALQGELKGGSTTGERQRAGLDALASAGSLTLGATVNRSLAFMDTTANLGPDAVLENFSISASGPAVAADTWSAPTEAALPAASGISASRLAAAGFDSVTVASNGTVHFEAVARQPFQLNRGGILRLWSGYGDVSLDQSLRAADGHVELLSRDHVTVDMAGNPYDKHSGSARVADGVTVDLSGQWLNQWLDGRASSTAFTGGGSFLAGGYGVSLGAGSMVDVSGGASVALSGSTVSGAAAGSIQLADYTTATHAAEAQLALGGSLRGFSARSGGGVASGGGSLSLATARVQIGDGGSAAPGTLSLGSDFFNQGGFGSFAVDGRLALDVLPGTTLAPQQQTWQARPASRSVATGARAADALADGLAVGLRRGGVNLALAASGDSLDATGRSGVLTVGEGAQLNLGPQATVSLQAAHQLNEMGSIRTAGGSVSMSLKSTAVDEANVLQVGDGAVIDVAGARLLTPGSTDGLLHGTVVDGGSIALAVGSRDGYLGSLVLHRGATLDASGGQGLLDVTERSSSGASIRHGNVASQGGSVSFSGNGDLWLEGDVHLGAQQARVAGGTLSVTQLPGRAVHQESGAYDARSVQLVAARQQDTLTLTADDLQASGDISGRAVVSADWVAASGASDFNLATSGAVQLGSGVALDVARGLGIKARALVAADGSATRLSGASVTLGWSGLDLGSVNAGDLPAYQALGGNASLQVSARSGLVLDGQLATQGLGQLALNSAGDLRLQSRDSYSGTHYNGSLSTGADLSISAAQVYPASDSRYVIDAAGHSVAFSGGDSTATTPLSAHGELQVQAAQIVQGGVLRAPLGRIGLQATESLTLAAGSETSVSANGMLIPYGTLNSSAGEWIRPQANGTLSTPGAKEVVLDAPSVSTAAGSLVNVSGGGDLQATEFVAGKGGSTDILAGGSGSYAIVPSVTGLSPRDPAYAATAPLLGKQILLTQAVTLGDGSTLAAGRYTLLPARYAMLPGAFLLRSASSSVALAEGSVQARTDGSVTLGARLADAGTGFSDSLPGNWQLMSKAQALTHSEIRVTTSSAFFAAQAAKAGTALPELPRDGGSLVITAQAADLQGQGRFSAGQDAQGVGGRTGLLDIVAGQIEVDAGVTAKREDGVLHLSAAQLNQLGSGTVVLGGSRAADGADAHALNVAARRISFQQGASALTVADLVAVATDQVSVGEGAVFAPVADSASTTPSALSVSGGGAALRVAAQAGAGFKRSTAAADSATLKVGAGAQFNAAGGSLVLDSSGSTAVAANTALKAQDITLASGTVVLGGGVPRDDQLVLSPGQLTSLGNAQNLTLRAYDHMTLASGASLGSPALQALVLDTPVLAAGFASQPVTVTAGDLTLTNTAGRVVNLPAGGAAGLTLQASSAQGGSGQLHLGDGQMAVAGAAQLNLVADQAVSLSGAGKLVTAGDLQLQAPGVVAAQSRADYALQAGGAVVLGQGGTATLPTSADGAAFSVTGDSVALNGRINLPSGQVKLAGAQGLSLASGASINTAGRDVTLDDQTVGQAGGSVQLSSSTGDIALNQGARIDVSGAASGGAGGSLALSAPQGQLLLGAALAGTAAKGAEGAQLHIDTATNLSLTALGNRLAGQHFTGEIAVRQREGDLVMASAAGLSAHSIALSADGGRLGILGTLDASGAQGGSISLDARDGLVLGAGSQLLASSSQAGANGGRVSLGSTDGQIAFAADSLIDLHAGAATATTTPDGGRLTLRAAQLGSNVAIAPLLGQVQGASRIDVQAVKVYRGFDTVSDAGAPGVLGIDRIEADAARFVGDQGQNATAIAQRLGGSQTALTDLIKVHAEAEVRSTGSLTLTAGGDLAMASESNNIAFMGGDARHVGDHSLTLRAGGDLTVLRGVSSGLSATGAPYANEGGSVRMVAGADLNAAAVMQTGSTAQDLVLAPAGATVDFASITGSSTGDLALAASGNLQMRKTGTLLLTTGRSPDAAAQAVADQLWFFQNNNLAFATQGGRISLQAGGSILANDEIPFAFEAYGRNSWAQQTTLIGKDADFAWYAYSGFGRGAMAFGGGDIDVRAGQDVVRLVALAPSSGYQLQATDTQAAGERHFAGGSVSVQAGRDVVDGMYAAGGTELRVQAGRDLVQRAADGVLQPGTRLYYEDTRVQVDARRDLTLGSVSSRFADNLSSDGQSSVVLGLDGNAQLHATAAGGDLVLRNQATTQDSQTAWIPASTVLAAPAGSLSLGNLLQQPQTDGVLRALAGQDLTVTGPITVNATQTSATGTRFLQGLDAQAPEAGVLSDGASLQDQSSRSPLQLVAAAGDLTVATDNGIRSARPLRWVAGGDISLQGPLQAQQQSDALTGAGGEQSLLQAGRDIRFGSAVLRVGGPGEITLLAGRDIDLGNADRGPGGSGLMATGNSDNALLAARSATVSLVAGLRADGADYRQAVGQGFELLGSSALATRAGDLYAWLTASAGSTPALGSAEAQAFNAQGAAQRLAAVKALLGDSAYQAALARYVRGLPGQQGLSDAQAVAAFTGLSVARQEAAPAALLAAQLASLPSAHRLAFISQVAAADTPRYVAGLQAWMKARTGQTLSAEQALAQFEQLPVERQLSWVNQVLVEELRTAGRAAASATGSDKEAAYLRGYLAIDTVFPGERPAGDIRLPSTQVKTLQAAGETLVPADAEHHALDLSGIALMTPGGGVNAGEVGSSSQSANNLGVVTVAGGDISAVSRDDFLVNQSRVFSLREGDILLWSSQGDIDAGRGAKTVSGAPAPVLRLDPLTGKLYLDTSGSFSGSGIAVLDARSDLDLYAPSGAIDAGEAGIRAQGNVFLGAVTVRGADNIQVGGNVAGATLSAAPAVLPAALAPVPTDSSKAGADDDEERQKRRRARRNLLLDFLGFGRG